MEHPRSPRGYTYIMTYWKVIRQLVAENVSNPLAKARRVWYNADTMLDTIFLRNQRNERKNRVKMDCLAPYGANNAERQKSGNNTKTRLLQIAKSYLILIESDSSCFISE